MKLSVENGPDFVRLMKRYSVDYTASHDQSVTLDIMEPDYALIMGPHRIVGRDEQYFAATRKQMDQFPGLGFTVHELHTTGERLVMRFSEHGASLRHGGRQCAWEGIGLYAWNGKRLISNHVEQDYFSRSAQLNSGVANPVEPPAVAPWDTVAVAGDKEAEGLVEQWLHAGGLSTTENVVCDDAWTGASVERIAEQTGLTINDLFSCGATVAFHVAQHGRLLPGFSSNPAHAGKNVSLYAAGLVHVRDGAIVSGRVIRNRLELQRSL
ncbi:MAG: nuclear transport factor 2 family protein [Alphaproteobacteria bacterium]|nr:MAG: nuclear transport factor 2 family protein [Alphaproteobacteria bacterium]